MPLEIGLSRPVLREIVKDVQKRVQDRLRVTGRGVSLKDQVSLAGVQPPVAVGDRVRQSEVAAQTILGAFGQEPGAGAERGGSLAQKRDADSALLLEAAESRELDVRHGHRQRRRHPMARGKIEVELQGVDPR